MARALNLGGVRPWRSALLLVGAAVVLVIASTSPAFGATFDKTRIVSDNTLRAYDSMSVADIQAFLDSQPGPLKSLVTTMHAGGPYNASPTTVKKKASQLIWDACQAWQINPMLMLALLQKEQSLISGSYSGTLEHTLSRAIGAGCPGGPANKYPGFGSQMWYGAKVLDGYGEGKNGSTVLLWPTHYDSKTKRQEKTYAEDIYQNPKVLIDVKNLASYKMYVYNPSIDGNTNWWKAYWRFFNTDPNGDPAKRSIFRFRSSKGNYLYTASQTERYKLVRSKAMKYEGLAFSVNTSTTVPADLPVYRFYNRSKHTYLFTASSKEYRWYRSKSKAKTWRFDGAPFVGTTQATGTTTVYRFKNKKTGFDFLTASRSQRDQYRSAKYRKSWTDKGVAFHLAK